MKILKETSFIAIFGFLLAVFTSSVFVLEVYFGFDFPYVSACEALPNIAGAAALSGIIALVHIKKKGLKGKWLAILAIILGIFGFMLTCL